MIVITIMSILAALLLPALARAREQAIRMYCMNNMKQCYFAFMMFANEHNDMLPAGTANTMWGEEEPLDIEDQLIRNNFTFDIWSIFPDYIDNLDVLICRGVSKYEAKATLPDKREWWYKDVTFTTQYAEPRVFGNPLNARALEQLFGPRRDLECVTNQLYTYLPYAVATEEQALFLWDGLHRRMSEGVTDFMREDLDGAEGHGPGGADVFYRTRIGMTRFFIYNITNPADGAVSDTEIVVLYDTPSLEGEAFFSHPVPAGGNVLFLDGHTEWRRAPDHLGRIPYTLELIHFTQANTHDNTPLSKVPPWCGNRLPDTPFEPRYDYYPSDALYEGLHF
jgi:prepilin-type processing-associated H-X9-DG protein